MAGVEVEAVGAPRPNFKAAADHVLWIIGEAKAFALEMHFSECQLTVLHILAGAIGVEIFRPALTIGIFADNPLAEEPTLDLSF